MKHIKGLYREIVNGGYIFPFVSISVFLTLMKLQDESFHIIYSFVILIIYVVLKAIYNYKSKLKDKQEE